MAWQLRQLRVTFAIANFAFLAMFDLMGWKTCPLIHGKMCLMETQRICSPNCELPPHLLYWSKGINQDNDNITRSFPGKNATKWKAKNYSCFLWVEEKTALVWSATESGWMKTGSYCLLVPKLQHWLCNILTFDQDFLRRCQVWVKSVGL